MDPLVTSGFGPGDDDSAAGILRKWTGDFIAPRLYSPMAGMLPQSITEVVVYRISEDKVEVLLLPRPLDDPDWPGYMHTPGTALRKSDFNNLEGDSPFRNQLKRLETKEVGATFLNLRIVKDHLYAISKRGMEDKIITAAQISDSASLPNGAYWFPVNGLPNHPTFIQDQLGFVRLVAEYVIQHQPS